MRILSLLFALLATLPAVPVRAQATDAARFNGTWEMRLGSMASGGAETSGEFRIWALDERRLRVEFLGLYAHKTEHGPTANSGTTSGVAVLDRGKAELTSEEGDCAFILRLRGDTLVVTQSGYGCFGWNVTAEGTYRRVDASRPAFEMDEADP